MGTSPFRGALYRLAEVTADELRWAADPGARWRGCDLGAVGPRELALLGEALDAGSAEELLRQGSLLAGESYEPPWVVAVPEPLRLAVADLRTDAVASVAVAWAERLEGFEAIDLARTLEGLTAFARVSAGPWALRVDRQGNRADGGA